MSTLDLPALDGANPLGFLAALGTVAVLAEGNASLKLGWKSGARWTPFLECAQPINETSVVQALARELRGAPVNPAAEQERAAAQVEFDRAKKVLKDAIEALKKRKLRGKERDTARKAEIEPLAQVQAQARFTLLAALKRAVPSPELALGQRPDCTIREFAGHATSLLEGATQTRRLAGDLLAAFGAEIESDPDKRIEPTRFCFITGSGHQWFLDTARQLMLATNEAKVREALFLPWPYADEKLTMRWDPFDDRRYALMDRNPTASDNKSRTVWMANLLAYRALVYFPCAPEPRGCATAGWTLERTSPAFTWPIWEPPLGADTIRSLLRHPAFGQSDITAYRRELRLRGVAALFRSHRIQVGNPPLHKINFSPAQSA